MTDEPDPGLDPIHHGIGKFIRAAVAMEETTSVALAIVTGEAYVKIERKTIHARLSRWADIAAQLPNPDSDQLLAAIDAMRDIYDLRHGMVHGIGFREGKRIESQRPDRRLKSPRGEPWVRVTYDRERLLDAGRRAFGVRTFIWSNMEKWRDHLRWDGDEEE